MCALSTSGTVSCWGNAPNTMTGQATVPFGLDSVAQVSSGSQHSCAVKHSGVVVCWGWKGRAGNWSMDRGQADVPVGLGPCSQVSAGFLHTCALSTSGKVTCWGENAGQIDVPSGLAPSSLVSAGYTHTCAVSTTGTATCWGGNEWGQSEPPPGLSIAPPYLGMFARKYACWGSHWSFSNKFCTLESEIQN